MKLYLALFSFVMLWFTVDIMAAPQHDQRAFEVISKLHSNPSLLIDNEVRDNHTFYGLASY